MREFSNFSFIFTNLASIIFEFYYIYQPIFHFISI